MNQKGFAPVIVVIVVVFAFLIVGGSVIYYKNKPLPVSEQQIPVPHINSQNQVTTQKSTKSLDTSLWLEYSKSDWHYSFKYPPSFLEKSETNDDYTWEIRLEREDILDNKKAQISFSVNTNYGEFCDNNKDHFDKAIKNTNIHTTRRTFSGVEYVYQTYYTANIYGNGKVINAYTKANPYCYVISMDIMRSNDQENLEGIKNPNDILLELGRRAEAMDITNYVQEFDTIMSSFVIK